MPLLLSAPGRLAIQPKQRLPIDGGSPLTKGLQCFYYPAGNSLVAGVPGQLDAVNTGGRVSGGSGAGLQPGGQVFGHPTNSSLAGTIPFHPQWCKPMARATVLMFELMPAINNSFNAVDAGLWGTYQSGAGMQVYVNSSTGAYVEVNAGAINTRGQHGFIWDGAGNIAPVTNGVRGTNVTGATGNLTAVGASGLTVTGQTQYFAVWDRVLSAAELQLFYLYPWRVLQMPGSGRQAWAPPTVAAAALAATLGGQATLTADLTTVAKGAVDFGSVTNTTRWFNAPTPTLPDADWSWGYWSRWRTTDGANYQYSLSAGTLAAANSFQVFLGEDGVGEARKMNVRMMGASGTEFNQGMATSEPADATTDRLTIVQRRGANLEIWVVNEGSTPAGPDFSAAHTLPGAIAITNVYIGQRSDAAANRSWRNPLSELFLLVNDSLALADIQKLVNGSTLGNGIHIADVKATRALDLRFRVDQVTEPDLSGNALNATRTGSGWALATEVFPDTYALPAAAAALAATLTNVITLTSSLSTGVLFTSSLSSQSTATAALTTVIQLAAAPQATATLTAALSTGVLFASVLGASSSVNASLTTAIQLASAPTATATLTAALTTSVRLNSALSGQSTLTAALSTGALFTASLSGQSTATASLTTAIQTSAALSSSATLTAALTTGTTFASALSASSALSGALTTAIQATAALTTSASASASLTTAIQAAAALAGNASALSGQLSTGVTFSAALATAAAMSGAATTQIRLAAALASSATLTPTLRTGVLFTASLTSVTTFSAPLTTSITMASAMAGQSAMSGNLTAGPIFGVNMLGVSTLAGDLTTAIQMSAALATSASFSSALRTGVLFSASLSSVASLSASATTQIRFAATLSVVSSRTATLTTKIQLAAALSSANYVTAPLTTGIPLAASLVGQGSFMAEIATPGVAALRADLAGQSTFTGDLKLGVNLSANMVVQGAASGVLTTQVRFAANLVGASAMSAQVQGNAAALAAALASRAVLVAPLSTATLFSATLGGSGSLQASLSLARLFTATITADSELAGDLTTAIKMASGMISRSTLQATLYVAPTIALPIYTRGYKMNILAAIIQSTSH